MQQILCISCNVKVICKEHDFNNVSKSIVGPCTSSHVGFPRMPEEDMNVDVQKGVA